MPTVGSHARGYVEKWGKPGLVWMLVWLMGAVLLGATVFASPPGTGEPREAFTDRLEQRVEAMMQSYDIPGVSMALIQDGEVVWTGAYGYAERDPDRAMTVDTVCRVESISKPVAAWGVMNLVQQGRASLDDPVAGQLQGWEFPPSRFPVEDITVRQLLSHNGGLHLGSIGDIYDPADNRPELETVLTANVRPVQEPGAGFLYSNPGYDLLELLVQEATGRDFAAYMQDEVLSPLGMESASFEWSPEFYPPVPVGHDLQSQPVPVYEYPTRASGNLFASVEDIARFVAAGSADPGSAGGEVLSPRSRAEVHAPAVDTAGIYSLVSDSYGLGHFIEDLPSEHRAVFHGGQGTGWMTHFHLVPETGDGIVILANSQRSWPMFSRILSDWAEWNGYSAVGMGRIARGQSALWALIGLVFLGSLGQALRLGLGLRAGRRRLAPLALQCRALRLGQGILGAALMVLLLWAVTREYLDITSVFPVASAWLGWSLLGLALVLVFSAALPPRDTFRPSV